MTDNTWKSYESVEELLNCASCVNRCYRYGYGRSHEDMKKELKKYDLPKEV